MLNVRSQPVCEMQLTEKKNSLLQDIADMKVSITELSNQIADNQEGVTKSVKKVREEMAARDDPESKVTASTASTHANGSFRSSSRS